MNFRAVGEIRYTYPKVRYIDKFYNLKSLIADLAVRSSEQSTPQKQATLIEKNWVGPREIRDYTTDGSVKSLSTIGSEILRTARVTQRASAVYIQTAIKDAFGDSVNYSIYNTFGRGSSSEVLNAGISNNTLISVRELFNSYGNEKFSVAVRVSKMNSNYTIMNYGIALAAAGSAEGIKGDNRIQVIEYTYSSINIDNADKYMSADAIKALTEGLSL